MNRPGTNRGRWLGAHLLAPADVAVGVAGACVLVPIELASLSGDGVPRGAAAVMLLACGLLVGVVVALAASIVRAAKLPAWGAAAVLASTSLLATVPVARHLFDGAFAATLPGAAYAAWWIPMVAAIALVPVLRLCMAIAARPRAQWVLALGLVVLALAIEVVNRKIKRSEYPDVHTFLVVAALVSAGVGARVIGTAVRWWPDTRAAWVQGMRALGIAIAVSFVIVAQHGFETPEARMSISTSGMHTRMLVRLGRGVLDFDGDEHSSLLAGGDCDDRDATRYPGAPEVPSNDVDENCDGITGEEPAAKEIIAAKVEHQQQLGKWQGGPEVAALLQRTRDMNLVLLAVDTLRADALADNASNRAELPNFFALLDDSRYFAHTFAPAAGTDLSMSGVLTGQIDPFVTDQPTLAEAMRARERATWAVIPSEVIRYVGKAMLTRGLDGHDRLVNDMYQRDVGTYPTGERTTELAKKFIGKHVESAPQQPFFLWAHYFDVHEHHEIKLNNLREVIGDVGELDRAGRYRVMVRLVDTQIGELTKALREAGQWDRTIVVLVSDHGEGLGEDPRLPDNHGRFVYNPLVHVPMAIRIPGVAAARIEHAVSLLDVYPTMLELLGAPPAKVDGESLLAHLLDGAPPELTGRVRPLPLNETDQFGVVMWPYKLLVRREDNLVEIFDLARDFGETRNLAGGDPTLMQSLYAAYGTLSPVEIDRSGKGRRARDRLAQAAAEDE